ncbi:uncharacterized protein LOC120187689 [Hibiscus syriacus]|uniref:uncharacterized protein LOC120187689 n=1 Tax=Hibiscus syriacus TaxID=106335 RepID=UPI00192386C0|nr:uncharacterized protein LOC120187689 [Hibiscus syriacus]
MESIGEYGMDARELSLITDLVLLHKFKTPEFEKYNDTSCPSAHVQPPLLEKETTVLFLNTMKGPFLDRILGSALRSFSDMWYDVNARCEYHTDIVGHSIENCVSFKKLVQNLIDTGMLKSNSADVAKNPLPNHGGQGVNVNKEESGRRMKRHVSEVKSPLEWVFEQLTGDVLIKQSLVSTQGEGVLFFKFCKEGEHEIQHCHEFKALIQSMMDNKKIEFFENVGKIKDEEVCTSEYTKSAYGVRKPIVITVKPNVANIILVAPKLVISTPSPFPFKDSRRVLWNYTTNISVSGEVKNVEGPKVIQEVKASAEEKMKAPVEIKSKEKGLSPLKIIEDEPPKVNKPVAEAQALEFLKYWRHSKYSVVEQLHKQKARISVLDLLINSEIHRNTLLKVLNQTFIPEDIPFNKLDRIVNHITSNNYITFTDDIISKGGSGSIKALNITTHCNGHVLPGCLIDNGSTLNVMPMATLQRFPIDGSHMKVYQNIVRPFDGTQRDVIG